MPRLRRKPAESSSIDPRDTVPNRDKVIETIRALGIPERRLIVMGSGALTLYGFPRRARDVDGLLDPEFHREIVEVGMLPNGIPLVLPEPGSAEARIGHLRVTDTGLPLQVDLLLPPRPIFEATKSYDEYFRDGTTIEEIRVMGEADLIRHKLALALRIDPGKRARDRYDAGLLVSAQHARRDLGFANGNGYQVTLSEGPQSDQGEQPYGPGTSQQSSQSA